MITVKVDADGALQLMANAPKQAIRATEQAIDKTAYAVRDAVRQMLPRVFDRPTPYTINSLKVETTKNHNMTALVWFKEPDRMGDHYLVPQVEGGKRKLKGFERALGGYPFFPSNAGKLDRYGNLPYGIVVQLLSVLGRAEYVAGYTANLSASSMKRNKKQRDYVLLGLGNKGGLPPGVYRRVRLDGAKAFGSKTRKSLAFGEWQKGKTKGKFTSIVRARGLQPVVLIGKSLNVRPRLPFYQIATKTINEKFQANFSFYFNKGLKR